MISLMSSDTWNYIGNICAIANNKTLVTRNLQLVTRFQLHLHVSNFLLFDLFYVTSFLRLFITLLSTLTLDGLGLASPKELAKNGAARSDRKPTPIPQWTRRVVGSGGRSVVANLQRDRWRYHLFFFELRFLHRDCWADVVFSRRAAILRLPSWLASSGYSRAILVSQQPSLPFQVLPSINELIYWNNNY